MTAFMHFKLGEGRATAAIWVKPGDNLDRAEVGLAFCSPKDRFTRRIGRAIAEGRLKAGKPFCKITLVPEKRVKAQVHAALLALLNDPQYTEVPSWVRNGQ
jgi:hypothetical protein